MYLIPPSMFSIGVERIRDPHPFRRERHQLHHTFVPPLRRRRALAPVRSIPP